MIWRFVPIVSERELTDMVKLDDLCAAVNLMQTRIRRGVIHLPDSKGREEELAAREEFRKFCDEHELVVDFTNYQSGGQG